MVDINNLGTFSSIKEVWTKYPEGGKEGDFLTINNIKYRWNKYDLQWQNAAIVTETPARKRENIDGDLSVQNDLYIGGKIHGGNITDGESAYQLAVKNGYIGTEQEWLESLHGKNGDNGSNGQSAYELWKQQPGNENKTEQEFLASLKEISDYETLMVESRPENPQTKIIYGIPATDGQSWTEEFWDGAKWVVLATHKGKSVETDETLTKEGGAADSRTVGNIIGYKTSEWEWRMRTKVLSTGGTILTNNVKSSEPVAVKAGSKIHAKGSGLNFAVISKYDNNTYTPLAVMNSEEIQEYVVIAEEDMSIVVSGMSTGEGAIDAFIENAGSIIGEVLTPYNTKLYTREEVPIELSMKPIKMNVGDIACVVNPTYNVVIMAQVDETGTIIKNLYRPSAAHGNSLFKYEKTAADGIDYVAINVINELASYGYILRRKPTVNILTDKIYNTKYDTFDAENCELIKDKYIIKNGVFQTDNRCKIYQFKNEGYKSIYVKTISFADTNPNYTIAFYNGEPSADTFMPIYSKNFWEHENKYDSGPYEYTAIVPDGCEYIAICMRRGGKSQNLKLYKNEVIPQVNDIRDTFQRYYEEYLLPMAYQHNSPEYLQSGQFENYKKVDFKFIFYTDLHENAVNLNRIMVLGDYLQDKGVLDCIIAGGDNCQQGNNDYNWYNLTLSQSKAENLVAVGNHDASTTWHATKESAYNNNIKPMLDRVSGIITPEDSETAHRLYYYKDYNNVRVIVLYTPPVGDSEFADDNQLNWLNTVLAASITDKKHVMIVNHHYYNPAYKWNYASAGDFWGDKPNTFLSPYGKIMGEKPSATFLLPNDFLLAVKAFEDAGGVFIAWITGHGHFDNFFDVEDHETYGYQPMFNSGSCSTKYNAHEFVKKKGLKCMDLFNYITVDTNKKMLNILRIGCDLDVFGRSKKILTYNYGAHAIIANY